MTDKGEMRDGRVGEGAAAPVARFAEEVRSGRYPSETETYHFAESTPVPGLYPGASA